MKISKELIEEVMKDKGTFETININKNELSTFGVLGHHIFSINIYEFAFKCKEWALKNKYKIQSQINESNKGHSHITKKNDDCWAKGFFENTEIEAIIKACEYILKELNENR